MSVRVHIVQDELSLAFIGTVSYVSFDVFLSFQDFIRTIMTEVVITALAHEHGIEVTETNWAIVLE